MKCAVQLKRRGLLFALLTAPLSCARERRAAPNEAATSPSAARVAPKASAAATRDAVFERLYHPPEGKLFQRKRPPQEGDWLARFKEPGQSFLKYRSADPVRPTPTRRRLVLQPLGRMTKPQQAVLSAMQDYMRRFFDLPVDIVKPLALPAKGQRRGSGAQTQHHTKVLLDEVLKPKLPNDAIASLGVTWDDLYPSKSWNYVFGMASLEECVGVYSLTRFFPEFWGKPRTAAAARLGLKRSIAVLAHETGHMFAMQHCTSFECLMNGSNSLDELDRQPSFLCPICLRKLAHAIGFDAVARYESLARFFEENALADLSGWTHKRLAQIRTGVLPPG